MKKYILLLFVCVFSILTYGQEAIFNIEANGSIIPKKQFIDIIDNGTFSDITPYTIKKTEYININNKTYSIKAMIYKGWETEPGDFHVVEITDEKGNVLLSQHYVEGWNYLEPMWNPSTTSQICYKEEISANRWALFIIGRRIASDPKYLTIIIVTNDAAKVVYNKEMDVKSIKKENGQTTFSLQENIVEWYNDNQPANEAIIRTMTIKNGNIYLK